MKKLLFFLSVLLLAKVNLFAQTPIADTVWMGHGASATGPSNFSSLPAATTPGSLVVNISQWNRGSVAVNAAGSSYNSNSWSTGTTLAAAQAANSCVYFTITNNSLTEVEVTHLKIYSQTSATGPANVQMMYNLGAGDVAFGSTLTTARLASPEWFTFDGTMHICKGQTATFKLYGWGGTGSAGTLRIRDTTTIRASFVRCDSSSFTSNSPVCQYRQLNLYGVAYNGVTPYTYSWSGPSGFSSTRDTTSIASATFANAGMYSLTVTDAYGCTSRTSAFILVSPSPTVTVTPSGTTGICPGNTTTLSATGGLTSYQWYNASGPISGATNRNHTVSTPGNYSVRVTNFAGCDTISAATTVILAPVPTAVISAASATTFCNGGSVILSATTGTGYTYTWYDSTTSTAISGATNSTYTATTNGTYLVVITNSGGCSDTSNAITVTVNPRPNNSVTASGSLTFCNGNSVMLTGFAATGNTYQWTESGTPISGATGLSYVVTTSGNYRVVVTNSFGCTDSSAMQVVTVLGLPPTTLTYSGVTTFCTGGSVTVLAPTGGGLTYQWYSDTTAITGATNSSRMFNTTGTYHVVIRNAAGCRASSVNVSVYVVPTATIQILGSTTFCAGNSALLTASTGGFIPGLTYQWKIGGANIPGATAVDYTATIAGSYNVTVSVPSSCTYTTTPVTITTRPTTLPVITYNAATANLKVQSFYRSYQWFLNTTAIPGATTNTYHPLFVGNYMVRVIDSNGCTLNSNIYNIYALSAVSPATLNPESISIVPNPATDLITIMGTDNMPLYTTISGIDGKNWINATPAKSIPIANLPTGLYIISIYDGDKHLIKAEKLIKN